jgi:hypothetical protein
LSLQGIAQASMQNIELQARITIAVVSAAGQDGEQSHTHGQD